MPMDFPSVLMDLLIHQCPDWTSPAWYQWFKSCVPQALPQQQGKYTEQRSEGNSLDFVPKLTFQHTQCQKGSCCCSQPTCTSRTWCMELSIVIYTLRPNTTWLKLPSDSSDPAAGVSAKRNKEGGTAELKDQIANHTTCLGRSKKGVATSR